MNFTDAMERMLEAGTDAAIRAMAFHLTHRCGWSCERVWQHSGVLTDALRLRAISQADETTDGLMEAFRGGGFEAATMVYLGRCASQGVIVATEMAAADTPEAMAAVVEKYRPGAERNIARADRPTAPQPSVN